MSQRGHGLSDRPLHGYDVDRLAADLVTTLEALGIGDATVVGHSFGGWSGGEYLSRIRQVEEAVSTAKHALDNLAQKLHAARPPGQRRE